MPKVTNKFRGLLFLRHRWYWVGRDSSVGVATRYGLDVPGFESWLGEIFRTVQTGFESHPVSFSVGTGFFPGVKRPGRGVGHPPPSSADALERVELYFCSRFGPSWPILGWTLPLPLSLIFFFCVSQKKSIFKLVFYPNQRGTEVVLWKS